MPILRPLRALRYGSDHWDLLPQLVSPSVDGEPLDRQDGGEGHPHRVRAIVRGRTGPLAGPEDPPYTHAARLVSRWKEDGVLVRDGRPAFYPWLTEVDGIERRGLLTLVRIDPGGGGRVLPHEQRTAASTDDLVHLLRATGVHTSVLLLLVPDTQGVLQDQLDHIPGRPIFDVIDGRGVRHLIGRDEDPRRHLALIEALRSEDVVLADGHHRWDAASRLRSEGALSSREAPSDYVPALLLPMGGAGVDPQPVLRVVTEPGDRAEQWLRRSGLLQVPAEAGAAVVEVAVPGGRLQVPIPASAEGPAIRWAEEQIFAPMRAAGMVFDEAVHDRLLPAAALIEAEAGRFGAVLVVPAPSAAQVIEEATAGRLLPARSTRFWPKPCKGLLMGSLQSF